MQPCTQEKNIFDLQNKHNNLMEILTEVRDDVKEIKKYIFEWPMEDKFKKKNTFNLTVDFMKEQLKQREKEIYDLKRNQNKVAWIIITAVLIAVLGIVIAPKVL